MPLLHCLLRTDIAGDPQAGSTADEAWHDVPCVLMVRRPVLLAKLTALAGNPYALQVLLPSDRMRTGDATSFTPSPPPPLGACLPHFPLVPLIFSSLMRLHHATVSAVSAAGRFM